MSSITLLSEALVCPMSLEVNTKAKIAKAPTFKASMLSVVCPSAPKDFPIPVFCSTSRCVEPPSAPAALLFFT